MKIQKQLAVEVSERLLESLAFTRAKALRYVPLDELVPHWGAVVSKHDPHERRCSVGRQFGSVMGVTYLHQPAEAEQLSLPQLAPLSQYPATNHAIEIFAQHARGRFTLAHELAHLALLAVKPSVQEDMTQARIEHICNEAAIRTILPDWLLLQSLDGLGISESRLTIDIIERISRETRSSYHVVTRRISQLSRDELFDPPSIVLTIRLAVSRKLRQDRAPRIVEAILPNQWFLPINRRLSSVGLVDLASKFFTAPLFYARRMKSEILLRERESGSESMRPCIVEYKCYRWAEDVDIQESGVERRLMLVSAELEPLTE